MTTSNTPPVILPRETYNALIAAGLYNTRLTYDAGTWTVLTDSVVDPEPRDYQRDAARLLADWYADLLREDATLDLDEMVLTLENARLPVQVQP